MLISTKRFPPPHLAFLAYWLLLLFCIGAAEEQKDTTGVVEVDLVFPRNETYNPSPLMPIVFSYRNTGLVPLLKPDISYEVWTYNNNSGPNTYGWEEATLVNHSSSDPYLQHSLVLYPLNTEGIWHLAVHFSWGNCYEERGGERAFRNNITNVGVIFTTKGPSKQIDLVAATSNQTCAAPAGIAINITSTVSTPFLYPKKEYEGDICPVIASPPTEADSCAVTIGAAAASSISASMTSQVCRRFATDIPDGVDCPPKEESAALRIVAGGTTCLAFMLGVLGYVL